MFLCLYLDFFDCVYHSGSSVRASQPFHIWIRRRGALASLEKVSLLSELIAGVFMSSPPDPWCSPNESHGDKAEQEAAMTGPGLAPHDRVHGLAPLQTKVSPPPTDELWRQAFSHYGLERPTEVTEIYVFRVQSSWDKNACTRSVTRAGPMSDPFQTLERIIDGWWDLEIEEHDQSWMLTPVNSACTWSLSNDLSYPVYVLTRKGNPFHLLRPHGVLEVVWGHRQWVTAIALPKWINNYHCLGLFAQVCGPVMNLSCAMWCDNTRLSEELIECHIGSFVQVHFESPCSDLVRIDLHAALQPVHSYVAPPCAPAPGRPCQDEDLRRTGSHMLLWRNLRLYLAFRELADCAGGRRSPSLPWQKS